MKNITNLNSLGCIDALEDRLSKLSGLLITLDSAMENENSFAGVILQAKESVQIAIEFSEQCKIINQHLYKQLPREGILK